MGSELFFVDQHGVSGIIRNDLSIKADSTVSAELRAFLDRIKRTHDDPVTLAGLPSEFLLTLYVQTSLKKAERMTPQSKRDRRYLNRAVVCLRSDLLSHDYDLVARIRAITYYVLIETR